MHPEEEPIRSDASTVHRVANEPETEASVEQAASNEAASNFDQIAQAKTVIRGSSRGERASDRIGSAVQTPASVAKVLLGQRLNHFRLDRLIGGGGMGAVFRAHDEHLDRTVAIKVIPFVGDDPDLQRRFRNESQSAAKLDHPHIARVFDAGNHGEWHYIVFEYVEGTNIRDLVNRDGVLSIDDAVFYSCQLADALQHAADRGIVHRDIKPSNVLIGPEGKIKLVDMGLARSDSLDLSEDMTASGVTLGTFDYISPEQARDPRDADLRSDLYSLGCTLYFMVTGQPPYPGGTMLQKLLSHGNSPPPDARQLRPEVSDNLVAVMQKMLAKTPNDRYQNANDLIADLREVAFRDGLLRSQSLAPATPQEPNRLVAWLEKHAPWTVAVGLMFAIAGWLHLESAVSRQEITVPRSATQPVSASTGAESPIANPQGDSQDEMNRQGGVASAQPIQSTGSPGGRGQGSNGGARADSSTVGTSTAGESDTGLSQASEPDAVPSSAEPDQGEIGAEDPSTDDSTSAQGNASASASSSNQGRSGNQGGLGNQGRLGSGSPEPTSADGVDRAERSIDNLTQSTQGDAAVDQRESTRASRTDLVNNSRDASDQESMSPSPRADRDEGFGEQTERSGVSLPNVVRLIADADVDAESRAADGSALAGSFSDAIRLAAEFEAERIEIASPLIISEPVEIRSDVSIVSSYPGGSVIQFKTGEVRRMERSQVLRIGRHEVELEDLHFVWNVPGRNFHGGALFEVNDNPFVRLTDCTVTIRNPTLQEEVYAFDIITDSDRISVAASDPPVEDYATVWLELNNVIVRGQITMLHMDYAARLMLFWDNGLLAVTERMIDTAGADQPFTKDQEPILLSLAYLTAHAPLGIMRTRLGVSGPYPVPVDRFARKSVFKVDSSMPHFEFLGFESIEDQQQWLRLRGAANAYDVGASRVDPLLRLFSEDGEMQITRVNDLVSSPPSWAEETRPRWQVDWVQSNWDSQPASERLPSDYLQDEVSPAGFDEKSLPTIPQSTAVSSSPVSSGGSASSPAEVTEVTSTENRLENRDSADEVER